MTSSTGMSGLIFVGSPPWSRIASRIAARSTTHGTPVKSWSRTRAGANEISCDGSSVATQPATASTSASDAVPEDVLEQDAQRVGQAGDVPLRLQRVEPVDRVGLVSDSKLLRLGHITIQAEGPPAAPRIALRCVPFRACGCCSFSQRLVASPPNVTKMLLTAGQVGQGYVVLQRQDGLGVKNTVTMDLCGRTGYPSEKLRTARLQVNYLKRGTTLGLSNEVVAYKAGGAAQAMQRRSSHARSLPEHADRDRAIRRCLRCASRSRASLGRSSSRATSPFASGYAARSTGRRRQRLVRRVPAARQRALRRLQLRPDTKSSSQFVLHAAEQSAAEPPSGMPRGSAERLHRAALPFGPWSRGGVPARACGCRRRAPSPTSTRSSGAAKDGESHAGWYCVRDRSVPLSRAGCAFVADVHDRGASRARLAGAGRPEPAAPRRHVRRRSGATRASSSYEADFGPSASYYAWEAAGRPVHGIRGKT